jgi:hypothetical protein
MTVRAVVVGTPRTDSSTCFVALVEGYRSKERDKEGAATIPDLEGMVMYWDVAEGEEKTRASSTKTLSRDTIAAR